jgi:LysR family transcriptional regulator, transcriptional activator of the cysJI operon
MDVKQLRTFVAVAELRHFARAASFCNLSQPAVSHQIALLEDEFGTRLLNRTARRVSTTVAGEVLLEEARRILGAVDRARERMQEVARGAVGRIRLGGTPTPGLYFLPPLLADYGVKHDAYDLTLEVASLHTLVARVAANDLDMAVVAGPLPPGELRSRALTRDEFVIIAPATHPLARARQVTPRQLASATWIVREEGSDTRRQVGAWWRRHRITPPRTTTFYGPEAVTRAVSAGLGIAMVSRRTIPDDPAAERVAIVRMKAPLPTREIHVIDHPQKHHGAACRAMLSLLGETFQTMNRSAPADRMPTSFAQRARRRNA